VTGSTGALGAGIGVITEIEGASELIRFGEVFAVASGVEIQQGDLIRTKSNASAQLEMDDGSILNAAQSSELLISDYQLAPDQSVERAVVGLLSGWLRFVTAAIGPKARYEIATRTATIGIRGTEGIVREDSETIAFQLIEGQVDVSEAGESTEALPALRLRAGEFYRRTRGKRGIRTKMPEAAFRASLPARFKRRPKRQKGKTLRGRKPKKLRALSAGESQDLVAEHPRFRTRLLGNARRGKPTIQKDKRPRRGAAKSPAKAASSRTKKQIRRVDNSAKQPKGRNKNRPNR